jgi:hypothetical protein
MLQTSDDPSILEEKWQVHTSPQQLEALVLLNLGQRDEMFYRGSCTTIAQIPQRCSNFADLHAGGI